MLGIYNIELKGVVKLSAKAMFVFLLTVSISVVAGILYFASTLYLQGNNLVATFLMLIMVVLVWKLSVFLRKYYDDLKLGMPVRDERTRKVRMYAAGYAYFISLYIWLILLIFHKYLDYDDALILGLLGMALSFSLSWYLVSRSKGIE